MLSVGITGGIGAGKSALADLLVAQGAQLIDSGQIARDVVEPPSPTLDRLVERFGSAILSDSGHLDRQALADAAFGDPESLAALNDIMHPVIGEIMGTLRSAAEQLNQICLYAIPLLTAGHRELLNLDFVVVVDCPVELAIDRLIEQRGFTREDAEARVNAQISREERNHLGDIVIMNDGNRETLSQSAAELLALLQQRALDHG